MGSSKSKDDSVVYPILPDGVTKERRRTDEGCCFLFLAVVAGMVCVAAIGFFNGDTKRLTHGRDYRGQLCGVDPQVKAFPYLYYCGAEDWVGDYPTKLNLKSKSCVADCPADAQSRIPCVLPAFVNLTMYPSSTENHNGHNITFIDTLNVEVTQSVAYQHSYPTEPYMGRYCVPQYSKDNTLREEVINGPLKQIVQFNGTVGSFRRAWPVILGAALVAVILGTMYLYILKYYAGLLIFISLWLGAIVTMLLGLFFAYGVFANPMDELGWYQQTSPVFIVCYGSEARLFSFIVGVIFFIVSIVMFITVWNENIDESIGVIAAAMDCILGSGSGIHFIIQPMLQAFGATFLIGILFAGFMFVASVTEVDTDLIAMNGRPVPQVDYAHSLMAAERRVWYWDWALKFYIVGFVWLVLTFVSASQYVVSYAVCDWYFVECELIDNPQKDKFSEPLKQALAGGAKRVDGVRVRGADKVHGNRSGFIEEGPRGKVLIVPLGETGPGGRDIIRYDEKITLKRLPPQAMTQGVLTLLYYHLGTIAMASIACTFTTPLRGVSEMIKLLLGTRSGYDHTEGLSEGGPRNTSSLVLAGFALLSSFLDEFFGRFSKNLYVDIVLRSTDFARASTDAYDFISETGGVVALVHGNTQTYEVLGVMLITVTCSLITHFTLRRIACFNDPSNDFYVSDPATMTLFAAGLSYLIANNFMQLFNMTADSLLYAFAWSRKYHPNRIHDFCPTPLIHIMGREIDDQPSLALQPQTVTRNRMARFSNAASRYKDTVMASMTGMGGRGGAEERPLLGAGQR